MYLLDLDICCRRFNRNDLYRIPLGVSQNKMKMWDSYICERRETLSYRTRASVAAVTSSFEVWSVRGGEGSGIDLLGLYAM